MESFAITRERQPGRMVLLLEGTLGMEAAAALGEVLASLMERDVTIDFSRAHAIPDYAGWVIREAIAPFRHRVTLRGLGLHQLQILRYLRIDLDSFGEVQAPDTRG